MSVSIATITVLAGMVIPLGKVMTTVSVATSLLSVTVRALVVVTAFVMSTASVETVIDDPTSPVCSSTSISSAPLDHAELLVPAAIPVLVYPPADPLVL